MSTTEAPTETAAETAVRRYLEFWNTEAPEEQRRLAGQTFADGVDYRAVTGAMRGAEQLMDFRANFLAHMGAALFACREEPQAHNDRIRLPWEIRLVRGGSFATGTDILELAADGRIASVTAFLDRAPEGFDQHHANA